MNIYGTNYTVYIFFNGELGAICIDFKKAIFELKWMLEFFSDDYYYPITILDDSIN